MSSSTVRGVAVRLRERADGYDLRAWCAWCDREYRMIDLGYGEAVALWVDYGDRDGAGGSMRVCSEGCAIAVRQADERGGLREVYRLMGGRSR